MEKGGNRMSEDFEISKETEERNARREKADRLWNKQWALDKSIEWCKHINGLVLAPGNVVDGKIMTSAEVESIADNFYAWLYKDEK
jgi:hypothetical protein